MDRDTASALLRRLGLVDGPLFLAYSNSNAVWVGPSHVVRAHIIGPPGRIANEVRAAARLPVEARYPTVVNSGWSDGSDWMVQERVDGIPLPEAWISMHNDERRRAIGELGTALRAVHAVDPGDLAPPCLFEGAPLVRREHLVEATVDALDRGESDRPMLKRAIELVQSWAEALDDPASSLIHGDMTPNNVMWKGTLTALIDFEWARAEARDCDLHTFLAFCADPRRAVAEELEERSTPEAYAHAPQWLNDAYPELFAHPRLRDRICLYDMARWAQGLHLRTKEARCYAQDMVRAAVDGDALTDRLTW